MKTILMIKSQLRVQVKQIIIVISFIIGKNCVLVVTSGVSSLRGTMFESRYRILDECRDLTPTIT